MRDLFSLFLLLCLFSVNGIAVAKDEKVMLVSVPSAQSNYLARYDREVLALALEATRGEFGPYEFKLVPEMSFSRGYKTMSNNRYPNMVVKNNYDKRYETEWPLRPILIPIDRGVMSYRVCLYGVKNKPLLDKVESVDQLWSLRIGQGENWADVAILKSAGFDVYENSSIDSLVKMTAKGRIGLFCVDAGSAFVKYEEYKSLTELRVDLGFALYYPQPRFFYTNKNNKVLIERLTKGLNKIIHSPQYIETWERYFLSNIQRAELKTRKIFHLDNPLLEGLEMDFDQYFNFVE